MTPRFVRLCLAVFSTAVVFNARAQVNPPPPGGNPPPIPAAPVAPTAAPVNPDDELVKIVLPDADIDSVLTALEMFTGRIILHPAALPTATYNLKITKPIPKSEAILAIETVLALNGVGVTPLGDRFLKVIALQNARQEAPEMIAGSAFDQQPSGKVATKVFQLEFMRVGEFVPMLQGILNPFYGGPVQLPNANAAFITDSVSNLQRIELLLQQLDKPVTGGMKTKFYQLRNGAKASDLVQKLRTILTGTLQVQLGQATTYNADDRTNQIILVTDPRQYPFFDDLIARLDVKADPNTRQEVIPLKHAKAADLVKVLSTIISGQTSAAQRQNSQSVRPGQGIPGQPVPVMPPGVPGQPVAPTVVSASNLAEPGTNEFSAFMTVVNDDRSNSVVVSGTADDIRLLQELIVKLDIVLAQVRIEVVIAEVTLDDNHESGISQLGLKLDGDKLVGFSGSAASVAVTNGTVTRPGGTATVSGPWDLAAEIAIGTTPRKNNTTILTVPAIVTSHGKPGIIKDGETRPIISGTTTMPGVTTGLTQSSNITQQAIGTTLTVTPYIGNDGSVQLDAKVELTDVIGNVTVDNNTQYIIGTRSTESYITAKSGEIIVMGGFRKKIDSKSTNRLGPIPFLGDLFGSRKKDLYHQELIFFLRPTVLTNDQAVDNIETMRNVERLPTRDEIKQQLDPSYQPPAPTLLDRILPK